MDDYIYILRHRFPHGESNQYYQSGWESMFTNNAVWLYVNNNCCYFNEEVYGMDALSKLIVVSAWVHGT